ncbi:hypothetical protein ThvES_00010800 [Thiovulum sp. ES]|nr:hypothetical protein ThvES_00010800 [Thiovulum sp. ES]
MYLLKETLYFLDRLVKIVLEILLNFFWNKKARLKNLANNFLIL